MQYCNIVIANHILCTWKFHISIFAKLYSFAKFVKFTSHKNLYAYSTLEKQSKDTIGEQVLISTRSLTFLHQRTDCMMRKKARRKDAPSCDGTPITRRTNTKLQSRGKYLGQGTEETINRVLQLNCVVFYTQS